MRQVTNLIAWTKRSETADEVTVHQGNKVWEVEAVSGESHSDDSNFSVRENFGALDSSKRRMFCKYI